MKKLLLIRHAKAVHHEEGGDFARPLSGKGLKGAAITATHLKEEGLYPQWIVSSPAIRTTQTAQIIAEQLQLPQPAFHPDIYEASEHTLLNIINKFDDQYDFIAMVGHNPGISYLLYSLTDEIRDVHPGTAILVRFEIDEWAAISSGVGSIAYYTSPKD